MTGKIFLTFPIGFENGVINIWGFRFKLGEQGRTEVETDLRIIVDEPDDLVVAVENPRHGIRSIALRCNPFIPVMIRVCRILQFDAFEPRILARGLVEMAVNANVAFHEKLNHGLTLIVNCFNRSSVSSGVLSELESSRLLLTGHHPTGSSLAAPDHHNPAFRNKVALAIFFYIVSNFSSRWDDVRFVDNRSTNFATSADFRPVHDDRAFDLAVTMNSDIAADNAVLDHAAANNGSLRDNRVQGHALAIEPVKDELGRWIAKVRGTKRPTAVIYIERRSHRTEIDVSLVVSFDGSDIAPITGLLAFLRGRNAVFAKVVRVDRPFTGQRWQDIAAKVMVARF